MALENETEADDAHRRRLARVEALADFMDSRYRVPIFGWRFGWDGLLGLFPVIGDTASAVISAYLIWEASQSGLPTHRLLRMLGRAGLDWLLGATPVVGDVFDFFFRANARNARALAEELRKRGV